MIIYLFIILTIFVIVFLGFSFFIIYIFYQQLMFNQKQQFFFLKLQQNKQKTDSPMDTSVILEDKNKQIYNIENINKKENKKDKSNKLFFFNKKLFNKQTDSNLKKVVKTKKDKKIKIKKDELSLLKKLKKK